MGSGICMCGHSITLHVPKCMGKRNTGKGLEDCICHAYVERD